MALNIGKEIAELNQMTVRELRERYEAVFGEPTRAGNKEFLFKRIAWRIQSVAEGDLSERAHRRAELLARGADLRTTAPRTPLAAMGTNDAKPAASVGDERVPPPGTVLTRAYRGQAYHVVVHEDGFEYDGQIFRSLSAIAKLITGSHWNGLLFFKIAKPRGVQVADAAKPKKKPVDAGDRLTTGRAPTVAKPKRRQEAVHA